MTVYTFYRKDYKTKVHVGAICADDAKIAMEDMYNGAYDFILDAYDTHEIDYDKYCKTLEIDTNYGIFQRFITQEEYDKLFKPAYKSPKYETPKMIRREFDHSEEKNEKYEPYNWEDEDDNMNILKKIKNVLNR